jgi:hypothetical protein
LPVSVSLYPAHHGFSKKLDNHIAAVALSVAHYNLSGIHEAGGVSKEATMDRPHTLKEMAKITAGAVASLVIVGWMAVIAIAVPSVVMR